MNDFHPLDQAAARIAKRTSDPEFTADYLIDLAKQELLGICFEYRGDVHVMREESPDGDRTNIGTIPFNGIVKLMQPPTTSQSINGFGVLVSILRSDGQRQRTGQPYRLPVPTSHGGHIKPGYKVEGFIDETDVPRTEWMIHDDDLEQIIAARVQPHQADDSAGTTAPGTAPPADTAATASEPPALPDTVNDPVPGTAPQADTSERGSNPLAPLTTSEIAGCFAGFHDWDFVKWKNNMRNPAPWLLACQHKAGKQGQPSVESTWWPIKIAEALDKKHKNIRRNLHARFKNMKPLKPWLESIEINLPDDSEI